MSKKDKHYSLSDSELEIKKKKKKHKKRKKYQKYKFTVNDTIFDSFIDGLDLSVKSDVDVSVSDETVAKTIKAAQIVIESIKGIKDILK